MPKVNYVTQPNVPVTDVREGMRIATVFTDRGIVRKQELVRRVESARGCPGMIHIDGGCYERFATVTLAVERVSPAIVPATADTRDRMRRSSTYGKVAR